MATKKKTTTKKKPVKSTKKSTRLGIFRRVGGAMLSPLTHFRNWRKSLRPRTPHKSFRRTYRRDYARSLELPGYIAFTMHVWRTLREYKAVFIALTATYAVASGLLVGLASQSMYLQLSDIMRSTSDELVAGGIGKVSEASALLIAGVSGSFSPEVGEAQQMISGLLIILAWLTTVWLLRAFLAGHRPSLKDGLYNSGAPLVPTLLLSIFLLVQFIPAALAMIGISAMTPTGLISGGIESMLFWAVAMLLMVLSMYWATSTLIALVVVTLPGMYPLRALKSAHELVVGRRLRIVLRIVWLGVVVTLAWALTMIPLIIFDAWIKDVWPAIQWLPIVPVSLLVASSASVVWVASYIYLLYRKVVDDDAAPA